MGPTQRFFREVQRLGPEMDHTSSTAEEGNEWSYTSTMYRDNFSSPLHIRTTARLCALFIAYSGERPWKAIPDRLRRAYCLSRVDHVWKIRDRKQRTDIGKYSFVNRTIKNWNQLPAEALGTFRCKPKSFRNRVRREIVNGVK